MMETDFVGRFYCPWCEPDTDPTGPEVVTPLPCRAHGGVSLVLEPDDLVVQAMLAPSPVVAEADGQTCRAWGDFLRGERP